DSLKNLKIVTQNLNGQPEPAKGSMVINSLKTPDQTFIKRYWNKPDYFVLSREEFKQSFPHLAYQDEDMVEKWETDKTVFSSAFDTGESTQINLKDLKLKPGKYAFTLKTKDKF